MNIPNSMLSSATFVVPADSYLVIPHTHAHGGVERSRRIVEERAVNAGAGEEVRSENVQTIADINERKRAEEIANRAKSVVARFLQYTDLGYIANSNTLAQMDTMIEGIILEAEQHNRAARHSFVVVNVLRVKLDQNLGPNEVRAIAAKLRTELEALRAALREGDIRGYRQILQRSPNLDSLCVGAVKLAVEMGLKDAENAYDAICENNRDMTHASKKGLAPVAQLDYSALNLGQLDTAIELLME